MLSIKAGTYSASKKNTSGLLQLQLQEFVPSQRNMFPIEAMAPADEV